MLRVGRLDGVSDEKQKSPRDSREIRESSAIFRESFLLLRQESHLILNDDALMR